MSIKCPKQLQRFGRFHISDQPNDSLANWEGRCGVWLTELSELVTVGPQMSEKQTAKSNPWAIFLFPFCQLNKLEHVREGKILAARALRYCTCELHSAVTPDSSWTARHISPLDIYTQTFFFPPFCFFPSLPSFHFLIARVCHRRVIYDGLPNSATSRPCLDKDWQYSFSFLCRDTILDTGPLLKEW